MAYVIKTCEGCGNDFENRPGKNGKIYHAKRHCSRKCWLTRYNHEDREHSIKGARANGDKSRRHERVVRKTRQFIITNKLNPNTYPKVAGRHAHRVIAEQVLGRELLIGEVVHHEDRNKHNNALNNLIVFRSQGDHAGHHQRCINKNQPCKCDCVRLHELGGDAQ